MSERKPHNSLLPVRKLWTRVRGMLATDGGNAEVQTSLAAQQRELSTMMQALRESEARYRHLVEHSHALIWRLDPGLNRLTFASPAVREIMGYSPEEILALPLEELVIQEDRATMYARVEELLTGRSENVVQELRQIRKDGRIVWCEVHAAALRDNAGDLVTIQGVTHDITDRKEVEQQRRRAHVAETERDQLAREIEDRRRVEAELKVARDRAEEANRLKSSILASMSHEIRTPLTGLLGFTDLLLRELQHTPHESKLKVIRRSGRRLLTLLNNMLDLARIEARNLPVELTTYPLALTVRHVVDLLKLEAEHKNLLLEVSVPRDLMVYSDPRRDEQILLNVIGNAIRYTEEGAVHVSARVIGGSAPWVELEVRDTGIGIDPSFMPQVFVEFRQESEGASRRFGGSGLGLAIARRLVETIGGSIALDSEKGVGTTVRLRFPHPGEETAGAVSDTGEDTHDDPPLQDVITPPQRPTVLVVEDDPDTLSLIQTLLTPVGEVVPASNSDDALRLLRSRMPDCALLDINLEGSSLDGYALLAALRASPATASLPIASMSAYAVDEIPEHSRSSFQRHFSKPLALEDVTHWVRQHCTRGDDQAGH